MRSLSASCWLLLLASGLYAQGVQVDMREDGFTLRNQFMERTVQLRPQLRTVAVKNLATGREFRVESEEFMVALDDGKLQLTSRDFTLDGKPTPKNLREDGKQVSCYLIHAGLGIKVAAVYEIKTPSNFWTRKWIAVDAGEHLINSIDVERFKFLPGAEGAIALKRFDLEKMPFFGEPWNVPIGRPLYAGKEMFLGLEYPAGHNDFDEQGLVVLRHHPGRRGSLMSRPAVIGVAPDQPCARVNDKFLQYIDRIRVRPLKRHVQWIAYFPPGVTDEVAVEKMQFAKRTFADRGVHLDCVLMDSGWTDGKSIMRLSKERPDRPGQIRKLAQEYLNTGLGLHVITSGRKTMVDKDWLAAQGYDLIWHKSARDGAYSAGRPCSTRRRGRSCAS